MRTPRVAVAATLMTLTLLTACGDGDDDSESGEEVTATVTVTPSETTSAPTETTTAPSTPVTPMDPTEGGDVTMEQVEAALLTPEEVGPDFTLGAYTEEPSPPLCDPEGTPVDEQIPPQVEAGTQIDHNSGDAAMQETISIYTTEAEASEAFALASAGLACTDGSTDGTPVTIGAAQDVTAEVNSESGLGTSTAWEVTAESFNGVVVATLAGRIILATQFASAPQFDTTTLPNPVDVATAAFAKALAN
jgi:hypothetical protein